jgi:hypothetical protein
MSNKKIEFNFSPDLAQKYSNLVIREIPLSATGVTSRVFYYLNDKKLIDYKTKEEGDKREWVKLNYFEAFWLMIIKELRVFGIPDKHIIGIKSVLFKTTAQLYEVGLLSKAELMTQFESLNINVEEPVNLNQTFEDYLDRMDKIPESDIPFITIIGGALTALILLNDSPVMVLTPNVDPETMKKVPLKLEVLSEYDISVDSQMGGWINSKISKLTIPLRPIFEELFKSEIKNEQFLHYRLITDKENQILDIIQKEDFKEIVIKKTESEPVVLVKGKGEIKGDKVKEIRKILGVKDYDNITLKFRNDKHIYYENESKH